MEVGARMNGFESALSAAHTKAVASQRSLSQSSRAAFGNALADAGHALGRMNQAAAQTAASVARAFGPAMAKIKTGFAPLANQAAGALRRIGTAAEPVTRRLTAMGTAAKSAGTVVVDAYASVGRSLARALEPAVTRVGQLAASVGNRIGSGASKSLGAVKAAGRLIGDAFASTIRSALDTRIGRMGTSMAQTLSRTLGNVGSAASGLLKAGGTLAGAAAGGLDKAALAGLSAASSVAKAGIVAIGTAARGAFAVVGTAFSALKTALSAVTSLASSVVGALGRVLGALGKIAGTAAAIGVGVAGAALYKSVSAASDLNEQLSATGATFGSSAKVVTAAADDMARKFGVVKSEFLGSANALGGIFKASGLSEGEAAKMSAQFGKLAADLSSFKNLRFEDALQKIQSGLVGEAEPLRSVGVLLSEAAVKQEAYAKGIARAGAELTEAQKVQARAGIITRQLADAQGDLARTGDQFANSSRALGGRITNTFAELGQIILPAVSSVVNAASELVKDVAKSIADNAPAIKGFADKIGNAGKYLAVAWREWPTVLELGKVKLQEIGIQGFEILKRTGSALAEFIPDLFGQIGKVAATAFMNQFGASLTANPLSKWAAKKLDWFIPGTSQELADRAGSFGHDAIPTVKPKWDAFKGLLGDLPNLDQKTGPLVNKLNGALDKLTADKEAERKRDLETDAREQIKNKVSQAISAAGGFFGKKGQETADAAVVEAKTKNAFQSQVMSASEYGRHLGRGVDTQEKQLRVQEETRDATKSVAEGLKEFLQSGAGRSLAIATFS